MENSTVNKTANKIGAEKEEREATEIGEVRESAEGAGCEIYNAASKKLEIGGGLFLKICGESRSGERKGDEIEGCIVSKDFGERKGVESAGGEVFYVEADKIRRKNERSLVSRRELEKFQKSIRENGFFDPVTVTRDMVLRDGKKRLCAAYCLDISHVPCVLDSSEYVSSEKKIIAEILKGTRDIFTDAAAVFSLIDKHLMTQDAVAELLGVSQSCVANKLRLLRLTPAEREVVIENGMSERHARTFLRIKDSYVRLEALRYAAENKLTVSATENYVDSVLEKCPPPPSDNEGAVRHACRAIDKAVSAAENLGIPVTLRRFDEHGCVCYSIKLKRQI